MIKILYYLRKSKILIILIFAQLIARQANAQSTIYVDHTANGNNDGSSWVNAYKTLAEAVVYANDSLNVTTIQVATGVYYPTYYLNDSTTNDRHKSIVIRRGELKILGGYPNGGGYRDWINNPTTISGDIGVPNDSTDNCNTILIIASARNQGIERLEINGFIISGGNANTDFEPNVTNYPWYSNRGAGIYAQNAINSYLSNIIFENNTAASSGAGIYAQNCNLNVSNVIFRNNYSSFYAGAAYFGNRNNELINVTFENNRADSAGGALYIGNSYITGKKLQFKNNYAHRGAALYEIGSNLIRIEESNFNNNTATLEAAAIYTEAKRFELINTYLLNNNGSNSIIQVGNTNNANGLNYIVGCVIANNKTDTINGFIIKSLEKTYLANNTIVHNTGLYVLQCPFYTNPRPEFHFRNNVIWNNNALTTINTYASTYFESNLIEDPQPYINNSNIDPNVTPPLFIREDSTFDASDYRLQFCSPLIDHGITSLSSMLMDTDIIGNPRPKAYNTIDVGAYELAAYKFPNIIEPFPSTIQDNNLPLNPTTCDANGWTYYYSSKNINKLIFAINWGNNSDTLKNHAKVYVHVDSAQIMQSNGTNKGNASLLHYWNVDLDTMDLQHPVSIRFMYAKEDYTIIKQAYNNAGLHPQLNIKWFMINNELFNPSQHITFNNINNGNFTSLSPSNIDTIDNWKIEVTFNNLRNLTGGTGVIEGTDKPVSIQNKEVNKITISPNPTKEKITLTNIPEQFNNTLAYITDITGRTIAQFNIYNGVTQLTHNWNKGIYILHLKDGSSYKIIKD